MSGLSACDSWRKSAPSLAEKNGYILQHEQFSDVSFCVGETAETSEIVKAHKVLLMTASQVFERMFIGNFKEASQNSAECPIEVADIDPSSFKTMLKYIYTDEEPENLTTDEAIGVVNAARKYNIGDLEKLCWTHLMKELKVKNCIRTLHAAEMYGKNAVKDATLKFLKKNFDEVLEIEDFVHLSFEDLRELLAADNVCVDNELQIFNGLIRWSEAKCIEQSIDLSPANQRLVLGELINLINFTAIPAADFALAVVPSEILTFQECTQLFQHVTVPLDKLEQLAKPPFSNVSRQLKTHIIMFSGDLKKPMNLSKAFFGFTFTVDKAIEVVGFGLFGNPPKRVLSWFSKTDRKYVVTFRLSDRSTIDDVTTFQKKDILSCKSILNIDLDEAVKIRPGQEYWLLFKIEGPSVPWSLSSDGVVSKNGVNFTTKPGCVVVPQLKFKMIT